MQSSAAVRFVKWIPGGLSAALLVGLIAVAEPQSSEPLLAEAKRSTSSGATYTAPAGWSIRSGPSMVVLEPPEMDSHLAIVDVGAADAAAAVAAAWSTYRPDFKRAVKLVSPIPPRDGWDEGKIFNYETSPNEWAVIKALARRAGDQWTAVIFDGTEPTFEKRSSQFGMVIQSLRPKGYARETFVGRKAMSLNPERVAEITSFVETSMKKLGIPGASLALVDGSRVVFEGGFGVRQLGEPTAVDANTLFMAASNTKGMTTLLLSRLADQKKLRWDQPVTELYPKFKLGDAETTRQVLVKHLVCACTGLPRQDLEWMFEFKSATPETSLALLGTMQPTSRFGEVFQYSNLMAAAAGYVGAHLYDPKRELGAAYDEAMQKMIFAPLGMNSTTFDMTRALKANHATPHGDDVDGVPQVANMAPNYSVTPHRPGGGVWTSAHDLIRYVRLELARGKLPDGKQLVSEENLLARRRPQIAMGEDQSYGMGLMIDNRWGVTVVHHGGSMAGFKSDLMFLPDHGVGAVLLTNSDNGVKLLDPLMRRLLEVLFDGKSEAVGNLDAAAANYRAALTKQRERLTVPADAELVAKLAEHYLSAALGDITVRRDGGVTTFDFGEWKSRVASRKNDDGTASFITIDPTLTGFDFVAGERSGKRVLVIRDQQHEYVFTEG
jgi:CubicO group peptidase (beta-lactamase class C family)